MLARQCVGLCLDVASESLALGVSNSGTASRLCTALTSVLESKGAALLRMVLMSVYFPSLADERSQTVAAPYAAKVLFQLFEMGGSLDLGSGFLNSLFHASFWEAVVPQSPVLPPFASALNSVRKFCER